MHLTLNPQIYFSLPLGFFYCVLYFRLLLFICNLNNDHITDISLTTISLTNNIPSDQYKI